MKLPEHMTLDELCVEGRRLQEEMFVLVARTQKVYDTMYHLARRNPDFSTPAYLSMANGGKRLAGMVAQGLKRATSFERVLATTKKDMEEQTRYREAKDRERRARQDAKSAQVEDALVELFGPDLDRPALKVPNMMDPTEMDAVFGEEV